MLAQICFKYFYELDEISDKADVLNYISRIWTVDNFAESSAFVCDLLRALFRA